MIQTIPEWIGPHMNLQQMRYLREITRCEYNISRAAKALGTNQPGVSKQVRLLEEELGFAVFRRRRGRLAGTTAEGAKVVGIAEDIVKGMDNIQAIGHDVRADQSASLVIAVSHTQARYVLPGVLKRFAARHPRMTIAMRHTDPGRIMDIVESGEADLGVTSEVPPEGGALLALPCRRFEKVVLVPRGHALARRKALTLADLAQYPMVGYAPAFTAGDQVVQAFRNEGIEPRMAVIAIGADVIKACVEEGLGIAVLSEVAFDARRDQALRALPAGHLFAPSVTNVLLSRERYVQRHTHEFIELCNPRWTRASIEQAMARRQPLAP